MRQFVMGLTVMGLLLALVACAEGPLVPTPTAIPLAATATTSPRPTRPAATATATQVPPSPVPATGTPTPPGPASLSALDDRLAERTVQDFLDRLGAGEAEGAFRLYLTDKARQGDVDQLLARFAGISPRLVDATLVELRRTAATHYEAQALLRWAEVDGGGKATQTMTLLLTYQRGLWLIDDITLGDLEAAVLTPTRKSNIGWPHPVLKS